LPIAVDPGGLTTALTAVRTLAHAQQLSAYDAA